MHNPYLRAVLASLYITLLVSTVWYGGPLLKIEKSILIPIVMLSLFTLSAAIMGYLFLGHPLQLYLDGKKQEAITMFGTTVATFAALTVLALFALLTVGR